MSKDQGEFSVYWWDAAGNQHDESRFVGIDTVKANIMRLTQGPAAMLGAVKKVMITDGYDCCNFLWDDGKILFPTEADIKASKETEQHGS
jgi:hypothetical protein